MKRFVPLVLQVMLQNPNTDWGPVKFPVVNNFKLEGLKSSGGARPADREDQAGGGNSRSGKRWDRQVIQRVKGR